MHGATDVYMSMSISFSILYVRTLHIESFLPDHKKDKNNTFSFDNFIINFAAALGWLISHNSCRSCYTIHRKFLVRSQKRDKNDNFFFDIINFANALGWLAIIHADFAGTC